MKSNVVNEQEYERRATLSRFREPGDEPRLNCFSACRPTNNSYSLERIGYF